MNEITTIQGNTLFAKILYIPLINILFLLYGILPVADIGIAIILLTILIRLILFPSFLANIHATQKMRELQPKLAELKELHKEDQKRQAEEMVKVYKEHKVNPLGSCLSAIIQLPILFALYRVFSAGLNDQVLIFLYSWFPFQITHVNTEFLSFIPLEFLHIELTERSILLAVLAGLAQFWQVRLSMKSNPITPNSMPGANLFSTQMIYIFPAITVVIGIGLPAALTLYWLTTTVITALQQIYALKSYRSIDAASE